MAEQINEEVRRQMYAEMNANRELLATQGALESYIRTPPETSEYIREFSQDRIFMFDDQTGDLLGGNIPKEAMVKNWAVDNPNYVFGNISADWERRKLELMELHGEMIDSMYQLNWDLIRERGLKLDDPIVKEVLAEKQMILNQNQQRIHAFMKKSRAKNGRERELMVTKAVMAGTTQNAERKKPGMLNNILSGLFGR